MRESSSVLFVTNSLTRGGSESKTVRIANGLVANGFRVAVAYLNDPGTLVPALRAEVRVERLDRRSPFSPPALRRLLALARSQEVDVLISVNLLPALYCYVAAHLLGRRKVRLVASVNTTTFFSRREHRQMAFFSRLLQRFDCILFGAEEQRHLWSSQYRIGRGDQMTAVLYNGVDTVHFSRDAVCPYRVPEWPESRLVIGSVGALRPEKSQLDIVRSVGLLRGEGIDVGALIVGDGPERSKIEELVHRSGLPGSVKLVGDCADVRPFLAAMDVFALPSIAVETFSNAALEAMAMRCPVVATRIGGMPEMLRSGGGSLYEPGDVATLARLLRELLLDPERRRSVGLAARETVERNFSSERILAQFCELMALRTDTNA